MTPKEKAQELADKYGYMCLYGTNAFDNIRGYEVKPFIKQCALIAVGYIYEQECSEYWQEVKQEIEKL